MLRFAKVQNRQEMEQKLLNIPIASVMPNPYQPRKTFSGLALRELAASIKEHGLLQPINVRELPGGNYELIAGERRLRASKMAGLTNINALVQYDAQDRDSAVMALVENMQRENLSYFEEAEGYLSLIREHGITQDELAKRLAKNQSTIANKLRILKLPVSVKEKLVKARLSERHARALLRLHNEEAQIELVDRIVLNGLSVKMTEELVEKQLRSLYGEESEEERGKLSIKCGYKLSVNTIRRAFAKLTESGVKGEFSTQDRGEFVEVMVKVFK